MSRRKKSQNPRRFDNAESDEDDKTPRPPSWSGLAFTAHAPGQPSGSHDEVERSFFAAGLSEEALAAASEREREQETLRRATSGRANRGALVVAALGACAVLGLGVLPKHRPVPAVASAAPRAPRPALPAVVARAAVAPVAAFAPATSITPTAPLAPAPSREAETSCDQLLHEGGKFAAVKATCGEAFAQAPNAGLAVKVAREALERERYADAQHWAKKAIAIDQQQGEAFLTLGSAEQGLGHVDRARLAYARYLELEPDGPHAEDVRAVIDQL
jgi:hypothetical protein